MTVPAKLNHATQESRWRPPGTGKTSLTMYHRWFEEEDRFSSYNST